jgi:NADH-quinone oxidoreductase subunit G
VRRWRGGRAGSPGPGTPAGVGVLTGGRLTVEDAYAYSKFARVALGTNDVDFRARPHSQEESDFLASAIVNHHGLTYADLETASSVLLVGFEPEEESPIVFLRLRKACGAPRPRSSASPRSRPAGWRSSPAPW